MERRLAPKIILTLTLLLTVFVIGPRPALAVKNGDESRGVIEGRVANATTGKPVARAEVKLYWAKGQEPQPERSVHADEQGRYSFTGLPLGADYAYVTYAIHEGVEYTSQRVRLSQQRPLQKVTLEVYGSTPLDSAVRIRSASFVVLDVNKASQSMFVLQTFVLQNNSKQTFRPVVDGPRGPMGLLRFSLPPNASQLSAMGELASRSVIQTDRGFGTDLPVRPGETQASFTYQVPYRDPNGILEFDLTMPYPTEEFTLLAPPEGARITSPHLKAGETIKLFQAPDSEYTSATTSSLPARSRLSFTATNLPVNVHFFRPDNPWLWCASGILLVSLLAIALLLARRQASSEGTLYTPAAERSELVQSLAALDEEYERGVLDEQAYRRERELRRQRLLALMATTPEAV